jgi:hypothetical protein
MSDRLPLAEGTAQQLRECGQDCRRMAATATTVPITDSAIRLAERLEKLAEQREQAG